MALAHELIADVLPVDCDAAEGALVAIGPVAMQLRRLTKDHPQAVSRGDARRRVAAMAPRAPGKLGRVHGAALGDEADAGAVASNRVAIPHDDRSAGEDGFNQH